MQCIYCLNKDPIFSKEHVISKCLWGLPKPILKEMVCNECNKIFDRNLENYFAWHPIATLRYHYKIREFSKKNKRPPAKINEKYKYKAKNIEARGMHINPMTGLPYPGVYFANKKTNEPEFFSIHDINHGRFNRKRNNLDLTEIRIAAQPDSKDSYDLIKTLKEKGNIKFRMKSLIKHPAKLEIATEAPVDHLEIRTILKQIFNFCAFLKGANFLLHERFNIIRKFIRYGDDKLIKKEGGQFLLKNASGLFPIMFMENHPIAPISQDGFHILSIEFQNDYLIGRIRFWNLNPTFIIFIAKNFPIDMRESSQCYIFNPITKQMKEIPRAVKFGTYFVPLIK